jgi:hypothetical protein
MLAYGKSKRSEKIKAAFSSVAQTIEKSRAVFLNGNSSWNTRSTKCILQSNPALYTYMVAETGLTFTSARENPHDAYAEYMGELPIFSLTKDMEKLSLIDY